jgi:hypothetical protein
MWGTGRIISDWPDCESGIYLIFDLCMFIDLHLFNTFVTNTLIFNLGGFQLSFFIIIHHITNISGGSRHLENIQSWKLRNHYFSKNYEPYMEGRKVILRKNVPSPLYMHKQLGIEKVLSWNKTSDFDLTFLYGSKQWRSWTISITFCCFNCFCSTDNSTIWL